MSDLSSYVPREDLVKSLQNLTGSDDVQLIDGYRVERATTSVDGFTSLVLRVRLSYRLPGDEDLKSHTLFVKRMSPIDYQREVMNSLKVFPKEWLYFSQVVPRMTKVSAGRVQIPLPVCYHGTEHGDGAAFYMEDLVYSGFRLIKRSYLSDGFDYPHCSLVMKGLGRLHALSLAAEKILDTGKGGWAESFPDFGREYVHCVAGPGEPITAVQKMTVEIIKNVRELCREMEGLPKEAEASGALEKVLDGAWPTLCRLKGIPTGNHRVLTHGDCWGNNMMFRYEKKEKNEEEPVEVKFFDLQVAKVCHPSIDLLYFMYNSTRRPFREKYFSALIDEYYQSLTANIKLLGGSAPPFSLNEFKTEVMGHYRPFGIIISTIFTPVQLLGEDFMLPNAEDMTGEKMEDLFNAGSASLVKSRFHSDPTYRSKVEEIFKEFADMALPNGLESVSSSPLILQGKS